MSRAKYSNDLKEFAADILSYALYMEDKECIPDEDQVSRMTLDILAPELSFYEKISNYDWFSPAAKKYLNKAREIVGVDKGLLDR